MIYITSDTHFNHMGIIEYEKRPFKNVDEMNVALISKWNSVVSNKDIVYHLGDFSWGDREFVEAIVKQLNGYKVWVFGL